jgi:hypothetical protein
MAFICAVLAVEYLRPFAERMASTFETSPASVPVPLKRRTGTVVVVVAVTVAGAFVDPVVVDVVVGDPVLVGPVLVDPVLVDPVLVEPVLVEPVLVDPVLVDPVLVDPVLVDPVLVEPVPVEPVLVDPDVVDSVVVDAGRGTGKALAGVPSVDPGVPHAVRVIDSKAVNPRITTRCNLRGEEKNESTDTSWKLCFELQFSAKNLAEVVLNLRVLLGFSDSNQEAEKGKSR